MLARVLCHMDATNTIIYVSQKAQTVPGHGKATPVGIPCVRPQSDMRCYRLDLTWNRGPDTHQEIRTDNRIKDESIISGDAHIKTTKKNNDTLLMDRSIMSIANPIPNIL